MSDVIYRKATPDDMRSMHKVFRFTLADLLFRMGLEESLKLPDDEELQREWDTRRNLYEHLARTAEFSWVATHDQDAVAFARSVLDENLRELTEFFALPEVQSAGWGASCCAGFSHQKTALPAALSPPAMYGRRHAR